MIYTYQRSAYTLHINHLCRRAKKKGAQIHPYDLSKRKLNIHCRLKVKFSIAVIQRGFIMGCKSLSKRSNKAANDVRQEATDLTRYLNAHRDLSRNSRCHIQSQHIRQTVDAISQPIRLGTLCFAHLLLQIRS